MDGIATYGIISRVMEALLSKEILTCSLIILSDSIMAAFDAWDTIANQVPVNFRPILTHFSNFVSYTHASLNHSSHTCFLEHTIIFLVESVPFNWSVLYIERKPDSLYQCHKVIDFWDLIFILLITSVVTLGSLTGSILFSCIKTGTNRTHSTTIVMNDNSSFSQPISVLYTVPSPNIPFNTSRQLYWPISKSYLLNDTVNLEQQFWTVKVIPKFFSVVNTTVLHVPHCWIFRYREAVYMES